jgi:hypothetical protein
MLLLSLFEILGLVIAGVGITASWLLAGIHPAPRL